MEQFRMQQSIRQNASEISDALSDLKAWGNEMQKKEKNDKQTTKSKKENKQNELPPIRNSMEASSQLKKNQELATKYKAEGNTHFKAKKYSLAIKNYSLAIDATPNNAVLYSNRAIAKLKNKDFTGAELDCNKCIELDSSLIKAWFRRGLARKSLKNYNKSLQDFENVLKMDPNNKAAKKEKIEIKNKLQAMYKKSKQKKFIQKKNTDKPQQQSTKMKRIMIQECDDSDSDSSEEEKDDIKDNVNKQDINSNDDTLKLIFKNKPKFKIDKIPTGFWEFEKLWTRAEIKENRSKILLAFKNKKLYKVVKNFLDDTLFSEMIAAINYIAFNDDIKDALILLNQLTKLDRFGMIVMFINDNDKKLLNQIKEKCQQNNLDISVFEEFQ